MKLTWIAAVVVTTMVASCGSDSEPGSEPVGPDAARPFNETTKSQTPGVSIGISSRDANGIEKSAFDRGEEVHVAVTVSNLTDEVYTISFPDPGYPAWCVRAAGTPDCTWDSRHDRVFAAVIVPYEIEPLATNTPSTVFLQVDNDGMALPAGDYEVKAWLGFDETFAENLGSPWHSFSIL